MKIFVKAFMDKNFGDDLMIIKLLRSFPNCNFYICCPLELKEYYGEIFSEFDNFILTDVELRKIHVYGRGFFNASILIGGSVLQGSRNKGCYYRFRNILSIRFNKIFGTKYYIIGCNTGPFINKLTEYFVKLELRSADLVTTRDTDSYNFIKGCSKKLECYMYDDILMDIAYDYNLKSANNNEALGISVLNSRNSDLANEKINLYFARFIDEYIKREKSKVYLLAFDSGNQNDVLVANKIYDLVENKSFLEIVSHDENYLKILKVMSKCKLIIGNRFHAIILGMSLKIPTFPLIYSNKTWNLLDDNDYHGVRINLSEISQIPINDFLEIIKKEENMIFKKKNSKISLNGHMDKLGKAISS